MGGRGGSSGLSSSGTSGLDVIKNGETTRYYFSNKNGRHYYQIGIGGAPQPTGILMFYPALTSLRTKGQSLKSTGQTQLTTHSYTFDTLPRMVT